MNVKTWIATPLLASFALFAVAGSAYAEQKKYIARPAPARPAPAEAGACAQAARTAGQRAEAGPGPPS